MAGPHNKLESSASNNKIPISSLSPKEYEKIFKEYGLNAFDFHRYKNVFSDADIAIRITYGITKNGAKGKPYLTFERNGKTMVMDAGIAGQCIGFIFFESSETKQDIESRARTAGKKLRAKQELMNGNFMPFNIDVFEGIVNSLSQELLAEAMEMTVDNLAEYNQELEQYGKQLKLEYIGNNPLLVFNDTALKLLTNLGFSEEYENCVGFIFRNPNENDEIFERRKKYAQKKYSDLLNKNVFLMEYSLDQLDYLMTSLPKKKEYVVKSHNSAEQKKLTYLRRKVNRFLRSHTHKDIAIVEAKKIMTRRAGDGSLSKFPSKFPIIDILFSSSAEGDLQFKYLSLYGWKNPLKEKVDTKSTELMQYHNVCGIVIVDDDTPTSERKKLCRIALAQIKSYYPLNPSANVIAVDSRLSQKWQEIGSQSQISESVMTNNQIAKSDNSDNDYERAPVVLKNIKPKAVGAWVYEPGGRPHIGGTQISVAIEYGGGYSESVGLDLGWIFPLNPTWNGIGQGPSFVDGIHPFLSGGMWGLNPRHYRTDLLVNSFRADVLESLMNMQEGDSFENANQFIGLELFHRRGREGFEKLIKDVMPADYRKLKRMGKLSQRGFWDLLRARETHIYSEKDVLLMLLLSHAHQDHSIGSSIIRDEIMRGLSPITRAILLADHKISGEWLVQDTAARKMRELPKIGASYPVFEYPYMLFDGSGKRVQIAENVWVSSFAVEHSIPGALAFKVEVMYKGKLLASIIHPGDYKNGDMFAEFARAGRVDLMFVEGTNPPGAKKDSTNHTEKSVKEKFAKVIAEANIGRKLLIIDLVKNNFERLNNIIEEATARGRTVVISPRIAYRCQFIELMQRTVHVSKRIKLPNLNSPKIKIWKRNMKLHTPEHRRMFHQYGAVNQDALSANPQQYVLIREGHERPEKITGIAAFAIWIRSVYGDYDPAARRYTADCERIARQKGWDLRRDGYHATGHGPLERSSDPDSEGGILARMHEAEAEKIAIIHTQKREVVHAAMMSYPRLHDTEIISRMRHPQKPGDKGHYIPVWQG